VIKAGVRSETRLVVRAPDSDNAVTLLVSLSRVSAWMRFIVRRNQIYGASGRTVQVTIIARAPLRIGLAGGGTDLPAYADRYGGLVVSATIDRYVYVILTDAPSDVLQITAADSNSVLSRHEHLFDSALFWGADYRLPMEVLDHFSISGGLRIFIASEVPPGTGLGSSSATAVALITALAAIQDHRPSKHDIAELASVIEIERMEMPIGRQDQFASSFGGLNIITFGEQTTCVTPCVVDADTYAELQQRVLLFFTGKRRRSTDILVAQRDATGRQGSDTLAALHEIKALAIEMCTALEHGDLDRIGELLDLSWDRKRRLAPGVSNTEIDRWYSAAKFAGAQGGKITGAGGGGFLMLYAKPEQRRDVIHRMSEMGLVWVDIGFERDGRSVVLREPTFNRELERASSGGALASPTPSAVVHPAG
jgi:D-glycero-alpha-D-manno-heptose-7-phosphate kinase